MGRFRVTKELHAGVYRQGVGHFKPGDVLTLPDRATPRDANGEPRKEKPSALLQPLDAEADAALVAAHPELAAAGKLLRFAAEPKAEPTAPATPEPAGQVTPEVPGGDQGANLESRRTRRR